MAFVDAVTQAQLRLYANAPYLTQANTSVLMAVLSAFLQADADTNQAAAASAPNINYGTASGPALVAKAADHGVNASNGLASTANVVFYLDAPQLVTITIQAGSIVATDGDGITTPAVHFFTLAPAIISATTLVSGVTPVSCTEPGTIGNVVAGTIVLNNLGQAQGIKVSNALTVAGVSNPSGAGVGGTDSDSDSQIRAKIAAKVFTPYGVAQLQKVMVAIPGVFDAYVFDPQNGLGHIYYYWVGMDGTAPTISGATVTTDVPDGSITYLAGGTLSNAAAAVDAAVRANLPVNIIPRLGGADVGHADRCFIVVDLSVIPIAYSAPAAIQSTVIEPLIQAAALAYVQSLVHNQAVLPSGLFQAVQTAVGFALTGFNIGSGFASIGATTAASSTASPTTIYRATGALSTVVCTRVT